MTLTFAMFAFLINLIIIAIVMKIFFKFMYPKPPKHFFPKAGDDVGIRRCDYCGHELATYRGILQMDVAGDGREYFFCNDEHQSAYFRGDVYQADDDYDGLPTKKPLDDD
ncbi:Uncharacterised protein [Moraxella lacunata]|uniref:TRASH domain-containing protein n=2 Tax=Moraxella lacunata TaxID=477 RepID=A0A378QLQ8_MORLA|nr:Uncharacterised protein [Moraxella lacunata]